MVRWIARLVQPFQSAADDATTKILAALRTADAARARSEAQTEAMVSRIERASQDAREQLERFNTTTEQLNDFADRMQAAGRSLGVLMADLENTSKGIEARVTRTLREVVLDVRKIAASRDTENQRLNDEAERWRRLAVAKYEADMDAFPPRVAVKRPRRRA